jgi:hypothetical protein
VFSERSEVSKSFIHIKMTGLNSTNNNVYPDQRTRSRNMGRRSRLQSESDSKWFLAPKWRIITKVDLSKVDPN